MKSSLLAAVTVTAVVVSAASAWADRTGEASPVATDPAALSSSGPSADTPALPAPAITITPVQAQSSRDTVPLPAAALGDLDIPPVALLAYQRAADVIARADGTCGLSWTLLAAIGRVESDHGRSGGATLEPDGTSTPAIRGVPLDGTGPVAEIPDTDDGQLDGDTEWDRAVGPMQFLPATWSVVGVDADGDSVRSPDSLADAALAAAVFLCSAPGDLSEARDLRAALFRYNPSHAYVDDVLRVERSYRADDQVLPARLDQSDWVTLPAADPGPPVDDPPRASRDADQGQIDALAALPSKPDRHPTVSELVPPASGAPTPAPVPTPTPTPTPSPEPLPTPSPEPEPEPEPSEDPEPEPESGPVDLVGLLTLCDSGWCLDELSLDVGDIDVLGMVATEDFDGNGVVETNHEELTGLVGTKVELTVAPDTAPALVLTINTVAYLKRHLERSDVPMPRR